MRLLITLLLSITTLFGYTQSDCQPYVPMKKGTTWEITNYSPKDKVTGSVHYELMDVTGSGSSMTFKIMCTSYDKKGEELYKSEYEAWCKEGIFSFDMEYMMNGEQMSAYKEMEMTMDASEFQLPDLDAPTGTEIPDGTLHVAVSNSGINMFNMDVNITNRKVEGKETIETDAGTFDCVKITQEMKTKMVISIEASSIDWYAPNIGMVRSESYKKNGKLSGYSLLTAFNPA